MGFMVISLDMYYRGIGVEAGQAADEEEAYMCVKEHKMKVRNRRNYEISEGLINESL